LSIWQSLKRDLKLDFKLIILSFITPDITIMR
jgi:hypothetical protein